MSLKDEENEAQKKKGVEQLEPAFSAVFHSYVGDVDLMCRQASAI